jgi:hypothetical protein
MLFEWQIKKDVTLGETNILRACRWENLKKRDRLENLSVDGKRIFKNGLKWTGKKSGFE